MLLDVPGTDGHVRILKTSVFSLFFQKKSAMGKVGKTVFVTFTNGIAMFVAYKCCKIVLSPPLRVKLSPTCSLFLEIGIEILEFIGVNVTAFMEETPGFFVFVMSAQKTTTDIL